MLLANKKVAEMFLKQKNKKTFIEFTISQMKKN